MSRILLFIDSLGAGGAQRQIVGLACMLKEAGHDVQVLTYHPVDFYAPLLQEAGVEWVNVEGAVSNVHRIPLIKKAITRFAPETVVAFLETPSIIGCILKMMGARWKLIVSERNTTLTTTWRERLRFNLFRLADRVVPNSFSQERYIAKEFPYRRSKITTITNFTDLETFRPIVKEGKHESKEIMVAASIWEPKNTKRFLEAVRILSKRREDFHISWYGLAKVITPYQQQCLDYVEVQGLQKYVSLLPKTTDIATCYKKSDFFCLPSLHEGTPNVLCEAIATGLPSAASDVCDNSIFCRQDYNGFLFDPESAADIARALERLLELTDKQRKEFGEKSRILAEELLNEKKFAKKWIDVIE